MSKKIKQNTYLSQINRILDKKKQDINNKRQNNRQIELKYQQKQPLI